MKPLLILFLIFGINCGAETFEFGLAADLGKKNQNQKLVLESLLTRHIDKLIMAGDNLYQTNSTYEETWSEYTKNKISFAVTAIGNHNLGYKTEMSFFQMPGEYYVKTYGKRIQFIVLNSDNADNVAEQFKFLEKTLQASDEKNINFLVYHHPTYTISRFHKWNEKKEFQLKMRDIFKKYKNKITAVLIGHDHLTSLGHFGDIPYILTGATQDTRSDKPTNNTQDGVPVSTEWFFKGNPTWAKLVIDDKTSRISLQFVDAKKKQAVCDADIQPDRKVVLAKNCSD